MPLTLYVATGNPGKLRDFEIASQACRGDVRILPLPGLESIPPPLEDAATFEENARAKAETYSLHAPRCIVLGDDSGLEVDALDGAPGVRSVRYAVDAGFIPKSSNPPREKLTADDRNNLLLLQNLRGVPANLRTARYRCVLAAARDEQCIAVGHGTVEGIILDAPRGRGGFGYDPLFFLPDLNRTMAEIDLQTKLRISHRGHALRALLRALRKN
jgi:XTP/dITP diphosphohydrolase